MGKETIFPLGFGKRRRKLSISDIANTIREEGYLPVEGEGSDVIFKIHGITYCAGQCANGFVYLRLYYQFRSDDLFTTLKNANAVEMQFVSIKVLVIPEKEELIYSVESFCTDPIMFKSFFRRALGILRDSDSLFGYLSRAGEHSAEDRTTKTHEIRNLS